MLLWCVLTLCIVMLFVIILSVDVAKMSVIIQSDVTPNVIMLRLSVRILNVIVPETLSEII